MGDDQKTLADCKFVIGDFLDIAITPPTGRMDRMDGYGRRGFGGDRRNGGFRDRDRERDSFRDRDMDGFRAGGDRRNGGFRDRDRERASFRDRDMDGFRGGRDR